MLGKAQKGQPQLLFTIVGCPMLPALPPSASPPQSSGSSIAVRISGRDRPRIQAQLPATGPRTKVRQAVLRLRSTARNRWAALPGGSTRPDAVGAQRRSRRRNRAEEGQQPQSFGLRPIANADKPPLLKAYLDKFKDGSTTLLPDRSGLRRGSLRRNRRGLSGIRTAREEVVGGCGSRLAIVC